ncbi:hypothetical protein SAMN02745121_01904 [Nannocystis exedens]|uniref:Uncharacterized protein n=1 Tax=Nannocystis exedens TaxID=54 RepID=A0A1I1VRV0_9BACT|nr:hypothetical protein NAEX_05873 [Nannocystis exedens]SFD85756.1 hypothetical protein SAMN02745121_01904 [Nannocystis exedens]
MVRPDDADEFGPEGGGTATSCCTVPAGESPVRVGAGAPGRRPQARREIAAARAGRQEPLRREQERGPQHRVKPAASSENQWRSRAGHVAAKATSTAQSSGAESAAGPPGVGGAARVQGAMRNRRGPSARLVSGRGDSCKPKAKSSAVQRESEGAVVPAMAAQNNAVGGKDPWGGRVGEGKREGMACRTGPNNPTRRRPRDKVRELRRRLWAAAKRQPVRRFHALYDRIFRRDVLREAWRRVQQHGLHRLRGTVQHPEAASMRRPERPPVSRVREIRTHGLNGGLTQLFRDMRKGK